MVFMVLSAFSVVGFLYAFCIADVIGIASIIFLTVMKNKQKLSAVLSDNQEEGK